MRLDRPEDAVTALSEFVRRLGGEVVPAHHDEPGVLPLDLSFGETDPKVARVRPGSPAEERLRLALPEVVEDARRMVALLRRAGETRDLRTTDLLTGLMHADALHQLVADQPTGDVLVGVAVPGLAAVEITKGRASAEAQLQDLARIVDAVRRVGDRAGRLSRWSVAVVTGRRDPGEARDLLAGIGERWVRGPASRPPLRTGMVRIGAGGGVGALADLLLVLQGETEGVGP